jgi:hypothetical protein
MQMFKKIAFSSGMPLIIVDLMIYLCGGYHSQSVTVNCHKAIKLLEDRIPPVKIQRQRGSIVNR